ncbi:DUF4340 domain-containing protein [Haliea sp. E17]|uniref:DUF4340 domain-containing protein n=1 Tax=Haliea sp. E17 TaxID=3401576 RepID=UPI003AAB05AC
MNRPGIFLLTLLLFQLGLLGWLLRSAGNADGNTIPLLVQTGTYVVDTLRIEDSAGDSAMLHKGANGWMLPQLNGLPADSERVEALLKTLTATDAGWAIAHSSAARQRFEVASYRFQRKITLVAQGRELGSVYIGSSPGFRRLYARSAHKNPIYSIPLNRHEIPAHDDGWLLPSLLQVRAPVAISSDGYSLRHSNGQWLDGNGNRVAEEQIEALQHALRDLRAEGLAPQQLADSLQPAQAELILGIESLGGNFTLEFYLHEGQHYLRSSRYPFLFRLPGFIYERIRGLDSLILTGAE